MKKLFSLLLLLSFVAVSYAGDIFTNPQQYLNALETEVPLAATKANTVASYEDANHVVYVWRTQFIDSSDNHHSPPLYIGGANAANGLISVVSNATGDVNPILHYSPDDKSTWYAAITKVDLNAASSTTLYDTLGHNENADVPAFHTSRWLVIELASGSTTNQDDNIYTTVISLLKPSNQGFNQNGSVVNVSRIGKKNRSNP